MPKDDQANSVVDQSVQASPDQPVGVTPPAVEPSVQVTEANQPITTPQLWFFPDIQGDGRAISVSFADAETREQAEQLARQKLEGDATATA